MGSQLLIEPTEKTGFISWYTIGIPRSAWKHRWISFPFNLHARKSATSSLVKGLYILVFHMIWDVLLDLGIHQINLHSLGGFWQLFKEMVQYRSWAANLGARRAWDGG